jgi:hypothetical protein
MLSEQRDCLIAEAHVGIALFVGSQVAQVADVPFLRGGTTMDGVVGVEVGACCGTPLSEVSELVDVDAVATLGVESADHTGNLGGVVECGLAEGDHPSNFGFVGVEDADGVATGVGGVVVVEEEGREGECGHEGQGLSQHLELLGLWILR